MSRSLGNELPPVLMETLGGRHLDTVAEDVIQLMTVDARGWPHVALLSYFEVVAVNARRVRFATYGDSTTTANMRANGKVTFALLIARTMYYVKGAVRQLAPALRTSGWNAAFECAIEQVLADEVDPEREPGAYLSSGIKYHNPRRSADLDRARGAVRELLDLR